MIRTVNTINIQSLSASAIAAIKDLADSVFLYVFPKIIPNGPTRTPIHSLKGAYF